MQVEAHERVILIRLLGRGESDNAAQQLKIWLPERVMIGKPTY
jgi:hypothetical protein